FLPSLISTSWGKEQLLSMVNHRIRGSISLEEGQFSWLGKQYLKGIVLRDVNHNIILNCQNFIVDWNLFQFFKENHFLAVNFENLSGFLSYEESGMTNIQKALEQKKNNHSDYSDTLKEQNFIEFFHVSGKTIRTLTAIQIDLIGNARDKEKIGKFELTMDFKDNELLELKAEILDFPVKIFDKILARKKSKYQGLATAFLGDEISLLIKKKREKETSFIDMKVHSPYFQGNLKGKLFDNTFVLDQPAIQLINLSPLLAFYSIDKQIQGKVTIQNFNVTLSASDAYFLNAIVSMETDLALENCLMNKFRLSTNCSLDLNGFSSIQDFNFYGYFSNVVVPMHVFFDSL
ncbi:MAG TPA: hypothetical protein PKE38_15475, partial [Ignavibacteriaceae bacterium]|nr:hypothetical protein [Ignavibacteriaceae bacterium]